MWDKPLESHSSLARRMRPLVMILCGLLLLTGCQMELYSSLPENDVNDMLAILLRNGIDSEKVPHKKNGTFAINVKKSEMPKAIGLLKQHGFPKEKFVTVQELFKKDGLISSPLEERVRFIYALSQDVQETLSRIDGVVTARVHIVLPENNPFANNVRPSSASVFIKYLSGANVKNIKSDIKMIVEKSIEGLSYDKVSVVMLPAQATLSDTQTQQWTTVWGVRLPSESAVGLQRILWGLGLTLLVLLAACSYLLLMLWRQRAPAQGQGLSAQVAWGKQRLGHVVALVRRRRHAEG